MQADPLTIFRRSGLEPDPWQAEFLRAKDRTLLLLCFRQSGKSTATAAKVLTVALTEPGSLILIFSPTLRQSGEIFRKVMGFHVALGKPVGVRRSTTTELELANGSRVVSLPDNPSGTVGYSAPRMVVFDEAARVSDELYFSARPMQTFVGGSQLVMLSTPSGQQGFFFEAWDRAQKETSSPSVWARKVTVDDSPRVIPERLEEERQELGDRWFNQEFYCVFTDSIEAVFTRELIDRSFTDEIQPLFLGA